MISTPLNYFRLYTFIPLIKYDIEVENVLLHSEIIFDFFLGLCILIFSRVASIEYWNCFSKIA